MPLGGARVKKCLQVDEDSPGWGLLYSIYTFLVLCLTLCHFVLVFFNPFCIAITSLGEERANLSAFRMFLKSVLVWICRFSSSFWCLGRAAVQIMALPGLFFYLVLGLYCLLLHL